MADEKEVEGISIKATLLGSSGVGKTCIIRRYTENDFDASTASTPGASYSQKLLNINGKQIQLDVWDTAGQEKYRSLGRHFYKDAYIVCLVYDITNKESFEDLKNNWYNDLKTYGEKFNITAVVGNKSDMYEKEEVKEEDARAFADSINSTFFLVSAKNGNNIDLLFNTLVKQYLGPEFTENIRQTISDKGVTKKIQNVKKEKNDKNDKKKKKGGFC